MISNCDAARLAHLAPVVVAMLAAGCARDAAPDYCRDHHLVHPDHGNRIGTLEIELSDAGLLTKELVLPGMDGDSVPAGALFNLQSDARCGAKNSAVRSDANGLHATYTFDCGSDNRLRQIDVSVFDALPDLEELVVTMTTPVTQKRFAISRQCERPIFRLD